ncbi:hypothetical protein DPMN_106819 [Dreissena polymorpha]|uniref:Uncharacterized protein n=1 Tax=Dreissena polymorpha TaxID=45954 RepID=A0A9D4K5Q0_DREPO|nr:hypothetical protein DPMN_106819 [Dreissena polymorpha]
MKRMFSVKPCPYKFSRRLSGSTNTLSRGGGWSLYSCRICSAVLSASPQSYFGDGIR